MVVGRAEAGLMTSLHGEEGLRVTDHQAGHWPRCGTSGSGESQPWSPACSFIRLPESGGSHFLLKWREKGPRVLEHKLLRLCLATTPSSTHLAFHQSPPSPPGISQRREDGSWGEGRVCIPAASGDSGKY